MRCLILLIIITLIYILAIVTTVNTGRYNFVFNFSIIPVLIAVFFLTPYEILLLIIVSSILAATLAMLHAGAYNIIVTILLLVISAVAGYYLKYLTTSVLTLKEKILQVVKEEHRTYYELKKQAQEKRPLLEKSVYDINSLYVAVKEILSSTTLEELLGYLKKSLKDHHFVFKNCKVILFSFKEKEQNIERVFDIIQDGAEETASSYEESLVRIMEGKKEPLVVDGDLDKSKPFGLTLPGGIETFIAIPLFVGNRTNGIFAAEDIAPDDILRCMILMHEFSMGLERVRLYELVQELAIKDGLTNIFVRRYILDRLREEVERAKNFNTHLSYMMVDIDHFKRCNDKYGHLVGDVVLREVANILKKNIREIDLIGRYGGEEFSVILPEAVKDDAAIIGERLRKAVEGCEIAAYDEKIFVTISVGITTFPEDADDLSQLVDKADQMLYKAKEEGRNRIKLYG